MRIQVGRWFPDGEIRIEASPSAFILRDSAQELTLPTTVWLTSDGKIEAVNNGVPDSPELRRVEIFKPAPTDPDVPRSELLDQLLRFGLKQLIDGTVFKVRPVVRFGPLDSFDPILSGFQREIFAAAAFSAGAREVRFDDPEEAAGYVGS